MKKYLPLIIMLMLCSGASAQLRTSRTQYTVAKVETPKEPIRTDWYVRAGYSMNNMVMEDSESSSFKPGFSAEVGFNSFFRGSQFYWGADLGLGTRGGKSDCRLYYRNNDTWDRFNTDVSAFALTAQFSPKVGYQLPVGANTAVDFHIGGFVSYDITESADGYRINGWDSDVRLQAGPQGGIGLWFNRFNIDVSFQYGFVCSEDGISYDDGRWDDWMDIDFSYNILFRLGYAF